MDDTNPRPASVPVPNVPARLAAAPTPPDLPASAPPILGSGASAEPHEDPLHAAPTEWLRDGDRTTLTDSVAVNPRSGNGWVRCTAFVGPAILVRFVALRSILREF